MSAGYRDYLATYRETILLAKGAFELDEPSFVEMPADLYEAIVAAN